MRWEDVARVRTASMMAGAARPAAPGAAIKLIRCRDAANRGAGEHSGDRSLPDRHSAPHARSAAASGVGGPAHTEGSAPVPRERRASSPYGPPPKAASTRNAKE